MTAARPYSIDRGRIRLGDAVLIYLERARAPAGPLPGGVVPRSHGVAPTAVSPAGQVLAAVGSQEAVWLGCQAVDRTRPVTVRVRLDRDAPVDAVSGEPWREALSEMPRNYIVCPPDSCVAGVRTPAGARPFGVGEVAPDGESIEQLTVFVGDPSPAAVAIRLVTPAAFCRITGAPAPPLDPDSAYEGRLLP